MPLAAGHRFHCMMDYLFRFKNIVTSVDSFFIPKPDLEMCFIISHCRLTLLQTLPWCPDEVISANICFLEFVKPSASGFSEC